MLQLLTSQSHPEGAISGGVGSFIVRALELQQVHELGLARAWSVRGEAKTPAEDRPPGFWC